MSAQAELPKGHPLRDAWDAYKETFEYANTRRWALKEPHVDGSLWAAFVQGHRAAANAGADVSATTTRLIDLLRTRDAVGLSKYGVTLDRGDLSLADWLQHMTEELLDGAGYAQAALRQLSTARRLPHPYAAGVEAAAALIDARRETYDEEHGSTDSETGAREYPRGGDEYVGELIDLAESVRALAAAQGQQA